MMAKNKRNPWIVHKTLENVDHKTICYTKRKTDTNKRRKKKKKLKF